MKKQTPKKANPFNRPFAKIKRAVSKVVAKATPTPVTKVVATGKAATPSKDLKKPNPIGKRDQQSPKGASVVAAVLGKPAQSKSSSTKTSSKVTGLQFAEGTFEKMCRENGCENVASTKGFCRLDYIKNWKKIKRKEMILKEGKLNQYIEELVSKYPDKYIDIIRQDLSSEVNFNKVIHDLELDESIDDLEYDGDSIDSLIGSVRKEEGGVGDGEF